MHTHTSGKGLKISYCTTCRGADYLERLKQALPENLKRNTGAGHYDNVEFVIVAYGDPAVTQWLKDNYAEEIKTGLIRAVDVSPEQAPYFKMAHAKNVAHRMATGDILCNLDCDNITGENFSGWLNDIFSWDMNSIACATARDKFVRKITTGNSLGTITGRIAISRQNYEKLHGYDEQHNAAKDGDDTNFRERAYASGIRAVSLPLSMFGDVLNHSDESRVAHMSPDDQTKSEGNFQRTGNFIERISTVKRVLMGENTILPNDLRGANHDGGFGCAHVTILNGKLEPELLNLEPLPNPDWISSYEKGSHAQRASGSTRHTSIRKD